MTSKFQRILIVGFGSMGQKHLRHVLQLVPDAEVALLRCHGPKVTIPGAAACFSSMEEALEFRPQAAVIAGPATLHREHAIALAGCAEMLLIEKPLASTTAAGREIRAAVLSGNARAIVGYNLRYFPLLAMFRNLLLEQRYGRLCRLECHVGQHLSTWRPGNDAGQSVSGRRDLGGGVLRELSHEIDYCLWICGAPSSVTGRVSKHLPFGDGEDCVDLWLEFPDGAHAAIHLDMIDHCKRRTARAICEQATLELDFLSPSLSVNGKLLETRETSPLAGTYIDELRDVLGAGANSPAASCEDGLAVLDVIEQAENLRTLV